MRVITALVYTLDYNQNLKQYSLRLITNVHVQSDALPLLKPLEKFFQNDSSIGSKETDQGYFTSGTIQIVYRPATSQIHLSTTSCCSMYFHTSILDTWFSLYTDIILGLFQLFTCHVISTATENLLCHLSGI
jgi:hypothetical protein